MGGWVHRRIDVDDGKLAARETGPEGRTVVLLHGLGAHQRTWDRVAKELSGFHIVTFDYRGHGRSDSFNAYSVDDLLEDLDEVLAQMGTTSGYVLAGHSIGADIALIHSSHAKQCRGIVLVDGALTVSPPETDWEKFSIMEDRIWFKGLMGLGRRFGLAPSMTVSEIRSLTQDLEQRRTKFGDYLSGLGVPILYVIGDQADKVPDGQLIQERKMAAISDITSRYDVPVEYVVCGHFVPMRQAKRLGELVRNFATSALD
jgi:pimeloyl-ACP methyl ester carboxylesterase